MANLQIGNNDVKDVTLGTTQVTEVWVGNDMVWAKSTPVTEAGFEEIIVEYTSKSECKLQTFTSTNQLPTYFDVIKKEFVPLFNFSMDVIMGPEYNHNAGDRVQVDIGGGAWARSDGMKSNGSSVEITSSIYNPFNRKWGFYVNYSTTTDFTVNHEIRVSGNLVCTYEMEMFNTGCT